MEICQMRRDDAVIATERRVDLFTRYRMQIANHTGTGDHRVFLVTRTHRRHDSSRVLFRKQRSFPTAFLTTFNIMRDAIRSIYFLLIRLSSQTDPIDFYYF